MSDTRNLMSYRNGATELNLVQQTGGAGDRANSSFLGSLLTTPVVYGIDNSAIMERISNFRTRKDFFDVMRKIKT